jgi:hypothetical protein
MSAHEKKDLLTCTKVNRHEENRITVKAKLPVNWYIISDDSLLRITEYSEDSTQFSKSLFFFSTAIALLITLLTTNIADKLIFAMMFAGASTCFTLGYRNYTIHLKIKKGLKFC